MEQFLKDLASGVLIPIATAIAAGWWKVQSKPEQASGEDRLLAFEHLVAAAALVIIAFFKAWQNPQGSKNEMGWLFALFVVLVFVLLGFANSVKNRVFAKSEAYYLAVYANPRVEVPVYRIDPDCGSALVRWCCGGPVGNLPGGPVHRDVGVGCDGWQPDPCLRLRLSLLVDSSARSWPRSAEWASS